MNKTEVYTLVDALVRCDEKPSNEYLIGEDMNMIPH